MLVSIGQQQWVFLSLILLCFEDSGMMMMMMMIDDPAAAGAMKFEAKKFQLREVVKHVLQMAHASIKNKSLVLEADIHPNVPLEV
jgi:hypothetical protein